MSLDAAEVVGVAVVAAMVVVARERWRISWWGTVLQYYQIPIDLCIFCIVKYAVREHKFVR